MTRRAPSIALLLLAGCSLQPAYRRPDPAIPASWPAGDASLRQTEAALPAMSYRDVFRDPKLLAVIDRALTNNQDLRLAMANVAAARAQYRVNRAQILPEINVSGGVDTGRTAQRQGTTGGGGGTGTTGSDRTQTSYSIEAGATAFEIDLFGRLRSLSNAAFDEYLGTEAAARGARLTLVSEVANAYLTLATDRSLLAIAADTEVSAQRTVDLTRARLTGGIAPRTDLRQAETILAQARADRAAQTTAVNQDRNALELLVGAPVSDADLPDSIESIDGLLTEVPGGLDSAILLRRPDVVQAEYQLRAENARIGAARAAFFPTISLTSVAGFASNALSALFDGDSFTWSVAPSATLPIFDGGGRLGNLALAKAQHEAALATYQKTIQTAFREVADALARRATISREVAADLELQEAARDSLFLGTERYRAGIDPYLNTLDAQRTYYTARRTVAAIRLAKAANLVDLYQALGGDQLIAELPAVAGR